MTNERENAAPLHRRSEDPPGSDFRHHRYAEEREVIIKKNGVTFRWLVGISVPVMVALLSWFIVRDHDEFVARDAAMQKEIEAERDLDVAQEVKLELIKQRQDRVMTDLLDLKSEIRVNGEKLDRILANQRRIKAGTD